MVAIFRRGARALAALSVVILGACSHHHSTPAAPKGTVTGSVSAASGPIAGSAITLYAPGGGSLGTATASSSGTFTVPYQSSAPFFYAIATGGTPSGASSANKAIRLMTVVSPNATSGVVIDELTTVASAFALSKLLNGSTLMNQSPGTQNAAATVFNLVTPAGQIASVLGNAPNGTLTEALPLVNTLADVLGSCISGGSTACSSLFAAATPPGGGTPTDTLAAFVAVARHPQNDPSRLFALLPATPSYTPVLTAAPSAWTIALAYANGGLSAPTGIAFDASGNAWITNQLQPGSTSPANAISILDPLGNALYGSPVSGGGVDGPQFGIAIDQQANVWIGNTAGNDIVEFGSGGTPNASSPYTGTGLTAPQGVAVDSAGDVFITLFGAATVLEFVAGDPNNALAVTGGGIASPYGVATDASNNAWITNGVAGGGSVTVVDSTGNPTLNSPIAGGGLSQPRGIAIDPNGTAWVANYGGASVTQISSAGTISSGSPLRTSAMRNPWGVAIDANGIVWVDDYTGGGLFEICGTNTSLCPSSAGTGQFVSPSTGYTSLGLKHPTGIAIDGAGNVWLANTAATVSGSSATAGTNVVEFLGLAQPTLTPLNGIPAKP